MAFKLTKLVVSKRSTSYLIMLIIILSLIINVSTTAVCNGSNDQFRWNGNNSDTRGNDQSDLLVEASETKKITQPDNYGDLVLMDYATLIVENTELEFNGTVSILDNSRLFIINSTVTISPPALRDDVIVVNIKGEAMVQLKDSTLITNEQPSLTNISYLISDDRSTVNVDNSKIIAYLPAITNQDIFKTPATAGTYILTGETQWTVKNSDLEGNINYDESNATDPMKGRWFWLTLQRKAKLKLVDTNLALNEEDQPLLKPISGTLEFENCKITSGIIDAEVISKLKVDNLTISHLNVRDQSQATIKDSNIVHNLDIGSAAIFSPETGGSAPVARVDIQDSFVGGAIIMSGNATAELRNCDASEFSINNNGSATLKNTTVNRITVYDNGVLDSEYSETSNIFIEKNSRLTVTNSPEKIKWIRTGYNCQSIVQIENSEIGRFEIWPGDNLAPIQIDPVQYDAGYDRDLNLTKLHITLVNSVIDNVRTYDDEYIVFDLTDTIIKEIIISEFKYENISFTFINVSSQFPIPEILGNEEVIVYIQHKYEINVNLNLLPVKATIEIFDENNNLITRAKTNDNGKAIFYLNYQTIDISGTNEYEHFKCIISYFGISEEYDLILSSSKVEYINLTDFDPPVISNIEFGPARWNFEQEVKVKAIITDEDIRSISNVTLVYSNDNGKTWRTKLMHELDEGHYEAKIPKQEWGATVEFNIVTYDILGNRAESDQKSFSVAEEEINLMIAIIIILAILILIGSIKVLVQNRKIKKYKNRRILKSNREVK